MFERHHRRLGLLLAALACLPAAALPVPVPAPLSLDQAQDLARATDPAIQRFQDLAAARAEAAVAAAQLPDPVLSVELMDVPADTLRLSDDPMTELRLGLRQTFPRGDTRRLAGAQESALAAGEEARAQAAERAVIQAVRRAYLDLHYRHAALGVLEGNRALLAELIAITEREFAAGRASQQDVLSAELEVERLEDRLLAMEVDRATAEADLARRIGPEPARRPLPAEPPSLAAPALSDAPSDTVRLSEHPSLHVETTARRASLHAVDLARQGYRPQWTVGFTYGRPTTRGEMNEPDRLSGMVTLDLPLFTRQRQDRQVAASLHRRDAAERAWDERLRNLERELAKARALWTGLQAREQRYRDGLLPQAEAGAEAAEHAYRTGTGTLTALIRARSLALEIRLEALRIATERRRTQADLLYLLGEEPA